MNESDGSRTERSEYSEQPPVHELHPYVACTWERRAAVGEDPIRSRVLPDGCVDLIWRRGAIHVAGPDTAAWNSEVSAGETVRGIRLRPGIAGLVLGIPASEVRDQHLPGEDVFPGRWLRLKRRLDGEASEEQARNELIRLVGLRLGEAGKADPIVLAATRRLGFPGSRVSDLAEALGISERQLRRRFHASVGYGPKLLDRILRFHRFASAARAGRLDADLARVAADLGYADQAHLSRDCLELAGQRPGELLATGMLG